jgi:capsular polysaccharide biosynthesis protein
MKRREDEISIKDFLNVILPKLWLILLVSVLVTLAVFVYSGFVKKDTYTSSFDIYIYKGDNNSAPNLSDIQTAEDMLETYEYILKTNDFLEAIILQLPDEYKNTLTPNAIRSMMSIGSVGNSGVLRISMTSSDGDFIADFCQNFAPIIPTQIVASIPNALKVSITESPSGAPISPNSRNTVRNSLIAFFVSMVLMSVAVFTVNLLDTTIYDKKKIEDNFDIPVLGSIPRHHVSSVKKEGKNGTF